MIALNLFDPLPFVVSETMLIEKIRHHQKASEAYLDVRFELPDGKKWRGSVPVNYRRTGVDARTREDCVRILLAAYQAMLPAAIEGWKKEQVSFWATGNKNVTKPIFDSLLARVGEWVCVRCGIPNNPNWARRYQDIKELGYTASTDTARACLNCRSKTTHLMLLPLPRGAASGYEVISAKLRAKIIGVLKSHDAFEGRQVPSAQLLPDHKFPEIRWGEDTKEENPAAMTEAEIRAKFQLLTNQRNQQKREACRDCYQSGKRGQPFGIKYFYAGSEDWPDTIPKVGAAAEAGCVGCGWYDLSQWRESLNKRISDLAKRG